MLITHLTRKQLAQERGTHTANYIKLHYSSNDFLEPRGFEKLAGRVQPYNLNTNFVDIATMTPQNDFY